MAQFLKDEVKEKIQQAALEVFTDKGFVNASIKEISQVSEVSVGNIYRYYVNKEALYSAVIDGVIKGITDILLHAESVKVYETVFNEGQTAVDGYEPLKMFVTLFWQERPVFEMLLKNGRDRYYDNTINRLIDILKDYFGRFWVENREDGLTKREVSALTNALVFGVIDLLDALDEEALEKELTGFISCLISGYFMARRKAEIR